MSGKYQLPFPKKMARIAIPPEFERMPEAKYALNFYVKEETPVKAVRDGDVLEIKSGPLEMALERLKAVHRTNYVIVNHGDGTFAQYLHLTPIVKPGQKIKVGEILGYTGGHEVGLDEPHLHFNVFKLVDDKPVSIPIEFAES